MSEVTNVEFVNGLKTFLATVIGKEIEKYIEEEGETFAVAAIEKAIENYAFEDVVNDAVHEHIEQLDMGDFIDPSDAIERAVSDYDMSEHIQSAVNDFDFDSAVDSHLQDIDLDDHIDVSSHIKDAIDNYDFDDGIDNKVESAVNSAVSKAVNGAVSKAVKEALSQPNDKLDSKINLITSQYESLLAEVAELKKPKSFFSRLKSLFTGS